jgi:hypothetical protein
MSESNKNQKNSQHNFQVGKENDNQASDNEGDYYEKSTPAVNYCHDARDIGSFLVQAGCRVLSHWAQARFSDINYSGFSQSVCC